MLRVPRKRLTKMSSMRPTFRNEGRGRSRKVLRGYHHETTVMHRPRSERGLRRKTIGGAGKDHTVLHPEEERTRIARRTSVLAARPQGAGFRSWVLSSRKERKPIIARRGYVLRKLMYKRSKVRREIATRERERQHERKSERKKERTS